MRRDTGDCSVTRSVFKLLGGGKGWRKKDCEDAALVDNVTRLMMMPVLIGSTQTV